MVTIEFWWIAFTPPGKEPHKPQVSEIQFEHGQPIVAMFTGTDIFKMGSGMEQVRLIERVTQPGHAAAAALEIDQLRSALSAAVSLLKERNEEDAMEQ